MLTKYLLISLFAMAQPGNHDIAMTYNHIATTHTLEQCELMLSDLNNLQHPPLANVVADRSTKCIKVQIVVYADVGPQEYADESDNRRALVSQAYYKWSGSSKPTSILTVQNLTEESCNKAAEELRSINVGYRVLYNYTRVDSICI